MEGYVLLTIAGILFIATIVTFFMKFNIYKNGIRVIGKVLELKKTDEAILDDYNQVTFVTLYKQIIEFETLDGEKIKFLNDSGTKYKDLKIGEDVKVVYNRKNTNDFYVDDKMEFFRLPLILFIMSILFVVFSFTLFIV